MYWADGYQSRNSDLLGMMHLVVNPDSLSEILPLFDEILSAPPLATAENGTKRPNPDFVLSELTLAVGRWDSNLARLSKVQTLP